MLEKVAVVALKALQLSLLEAEQPIHGSIEKVAVMGHDDHAATEVLEEVLEDAQGLDIEIVGGFIQQQHIGRLNQHSTQREAPPFPA